MKFLILITFVFSISSFAQKGGRIIYKYKKYEKFDFSELSIEGATGSPGDLSITPRFQKKFRNKLPYRKNFNPEIYKSIQSIR